MTLKNNNRQQGFVIPLVLIIIAILTSLAMGLSHQSRNQLKNLQRHETQWKTELAYRSALHRIIYALLIGQVDYNVVKVNQLEIPIDDRSFKIDDINVRLQDIAGLLSLGIYRPEWLYRLLAHLTDDQRAMRICQELGDWIDENNIVQRHGMELNDYIQAGIAYRPRNKMIRSLDELLELPSMTNELYNGSETMQGLRDLLVAGGSQTINAATAPKIVLQAAINVPQEQWRSIWAARESENWSLLSKLLPAGSPAFADLGPFSPAYIYRIIMQKPGEKAMRIIVRLTPDNDPPYKIQQWYYPDDDRG